MKDYASFDNHVLTQQFRRLSHKITQITLKKLELVISEYNEQRLQLAQMIKEFDKRGLVGKMPDNVQRLQVSTARPSKDESDSKDR